MGEEIVMRRAIALSILTLMTAVFFLNPAFAYSPLQATTGDLGLKTLSAGIAFGLAALGAGIAISGAGSAGLASSAERLELRTLALIITSLGEAIAIYGIVVAILILGTS